MWTRRTIKQELPLAKGRGELFVDAADRPTLRDDVSRDDPDHVAGNRLAASSFSKQANGVTENSEAITLWLRRADQLLLGFLLIALLVLLIAFRWKLTGGGWGEIEIVSQQPREYYYSLEINRASWVEWAQLDGIGEKLARRIVRDREERGPFSSVEEIRRVRGIGPKQIEKLRPFLKCEDEQMQTTHRTANEPE
jgi:competence protein ComEA